MNSVIKSSFYITLGLLLSRLLGLGRDLLVSARWGATESSDAVLLVLNLPDMIPNLFLGGAISALMVPRFVNANTENRNRYYSIAFQSLALYGLVVALAMAVFADSLTQLMAPGFSDSAKEQTAASIRHVSVAVLLMFIANLPRAFLQSVENFKVSSMENVFFNLPLILFLYWYTEPGNFGFLSAVIVGASIVRLAYMLGSAHRLGMKLKVVKVPVKADVIKRFVQLVVTSGCVILLLFILRALATELGPGSLSIFMYFYKIIEVPFGILTTIVFSISLPRLASGKAKTDQKHVTKLVGLSTGLAIIGYGVCWGLAGQGISVLKFTPDDIKSLLEIMAIGSLALPARIALTYLQSYEYSQLGSGKGLVANTVSMAWVALFLWIFREKISLAVLVWALNLYYLIAALSLFLLVFKRAKVAGL